MVSIINILNWFILFYLILLSMGYIVLLFSSIPDIFLRYKESDVGNVMSLMQSPSLPPVTIIVPAHNEAEIILQTIESIVMNVYPNIYIIIVNAGSTDHTLQLLIDEYQLAKVEPIIQNKIKTNDPIRGFYVSQAYKRNITVIDKLGTEKSDALNTAINACTTPLYISVDADTLLEPDAISFLVYYLLTRPFAAAVGGALYILNGCYFDHGQIVAKRMSLSPLHAFQTCEYMRSFLFNRSGWNFFGGALCYAGAFTLFRQHEVVDIGGYVHNNKSEDFEIITHLIANKYERKLPYTVGYSASATAWTDVPGTLTNYWAQRFNWQYYSLKSLMGHSKMLFNPRYGLVGFFTYPFYLFGEILGAVVEFVAYILVILSWYLGILNTYAVVVFFVLCVGFSVLLTIATSLINFLTFNKYRRFGDLPWIFLYSLIEFFGFRQYSVLCRTTATCCYFLDSIKQRFARRKTE